MQDVIVIGAGVVGCAVARRLATYKLDVIVLEAAEDVADGASKANSGIVHAGFDALPGTKKAYYNVKGARMYEALCAEMGVPYRKNGALVLTFTEEDLPALRALYDRGTANGVQGMRLLSAEETRAMEPNVSPAVTGALLAEESGIVSPYEMTIALAYHAAQNGARFVFDAPVTALKKTDKGFEAVTPKGTYTARAIINCAGLGADQLHNMLSEDRRHITPRKGEYYLLDHTMQCPFDHTMFQVPGKMGKGVLVTPTAHGNTLLGPSAADVRDPLDTATTADGLAFVMEKCRLTWPQAGSRNTITTFAGNRAHEDGDDFVIGPVAGCEGAFEAAGIESPGLSSAPAIGEELGDMAASWLKAEKKEQVLPPVPLLRPFSAMTNEERAEHCKADDNWGQMVCRCEQVTEAEILDALHRPVPARSVDGVKRRTRAGMGRCQGGFCSPRVMQMISEETGIPMTEVTKCGGESRMVLGTINDLTKGGAR